jgi:hypothetical protein
VAFASIAVRATIKIHECLEHCPPGAPAESRWLARGMRVSCEALGDFVIDPELVRFVRDHDRVYKLEEGVALLNELRENRDRIEEFLAAETELFNQVGLPVSATAHLIQRCREVIVDGRYKDRSDITQDLVSLRRYVCAKADLLEAGRRRGVLRGMRDVVGGLATASLNGGLLAATVGISGALSAASMVVGGVVAAEGYATIRGYY